MAERTDAGPAARGRGRPREVERRPAGEGLPCERPLEALPLTAQTVLAAARGIVREAVKARTVEDRLRAHVKAIRDLLREGDGSSGRACFGLHYDMDPAGCPLDEVFELLLGLVLAETRRLTGG